MQLRPSEKSWQSALAAEFTKPYYQDLSADVLQAYEEGAAYPKREHLFAALDLCPLYQTKVVILGQDPYHRPGQAHGLCFSVPDSQPLPPSLRNIFSEISNDTNTPQPISGNLTRWAKQGVLLLNSTLSVAPGQPASHRSWGWERFTDTIIQTLDSSEVPVAFLLWGAAAQSKAQRITNPKHLILQAPHPSPLSAYRGWFGCKHFSKTNDWLNKNGHTPIVW